MSLIFIFLFSFNIKEFFYQHEKYGVDDNFSKTEISFVKPEKIKYKIEFKSIKKDKNKTLETFFSSDIEKVTENKDEIFKDYFIFKNIKQFHKINNKKFINKKLLKQFPKNNKKEVVFKNGIFHLKEKINSIDSSIFEFLLLDIDFKKKLYVGELWSFEKDKIINIENYDYHYKEKYFIKFIGYKKDKRVFKINYFLENDSLIEKKILDGYGEILLIIDNNMIEKIDGHIKLKIEKIESNIFFKLLKQ